MAAVTIPTRFEASLALGDGSAGANLTEVLQLTSSEVPNLYSASSNQFVYCFQVTIHAFLYRVTEHFSMYSLSQERGVAYGEKEASNMKAEASFPLSVGVSVSFSLQFINQPVEKWGINFAGSVRVSHKTGEERLIYLPGTRTYDPAGITGVWVCQCV